MIHCELLGEDLLTLRYGLIDFTSITNILSISAFTDFLNKRFESIVLYIFPYNI